MIKEILDSTQSSMDNAINHTVKELKKIRTGRANPEILNSIYIDYYGSKTALNQVSTITTPEARLINIAPYEKNLIPEIEKAIVNSNMGLTPNNNGSSIIIPIPPLSEERRKELIKVAHGIIEDGKVSIRNIRRDSIHQLTHKGKEENVSEDLIKDNEGEIQALTDKNINRLVQIERDKEKEIIEV